MLAASEQPLTWNLPASMLFSHLFPSVVTVVKGIRGRKEMMSEVWYLLLFVLKVLSPRTSFAHLNWKCSSKAHKTYHSSDESLLMDIRRFAAV